LRRAGECEEATSGSSDLPLRDHTRISDVDVDVDVDIKLRVDEITSELERASISHENNDTTTTGDRPSSPIDRGLLARDVVAGGVMIAKVDIVVTSIASPEGLLTTTQTQTHRLTRTTAESGTGVMVDKLSTVSMKEITLVADIVAEQTGTLTNLNNAVISDNVVPYKLIVYVVTFLA
jgi:hypothetical protein